MMDKDDVKQIFTDEEKRQMRSTSPAFENHVGVDIRAVSEIAKKFRQARDNPSRKDIIARAIETTEDIVMELQDLIAELKRVPPDS